MNRRSELVVFHRDVITDLLGTMITAPLIAEIFDGALFKLFTNAFNPNPDMITTDFIIATFVGYANDTATWEPLGNTDTGRYATAQLSYTGGAVVAPGEVIEGYYVTDGASTVVLCAERFVTPVPIAVPGDQLLLDFVVEIPFNWPVTP